MAVFLCLRILLISSRVFLARDAAMSAMRSYSLTTTGASRSTADYVLSFGSTFFLFCSTVTKCLPRWKLSSLSFFGPGCSYSMMSLFFPLLAVLTFLDVILRFW